MASQELLDKLRHWIFEDDVFAAITAWAEERTAGFDLTAPAEEHRLEWTAMHKDFETFFESRLEKFCLSAGTTPEELHAHLEAEVTKDPSGEAAQIVEFLLASAEYETFVGMMRSITQQKQAQAADAAAEAAAGEAGGAQ